MLKRLGVLASSRGTNMQALLDACRSGQLSAELAVVISNNRNSGALSRAQAHGVPCYCLNESSFDDSDELDQAILRTLERHLVDWVLALGYMKKIGPRMLQAYRNRIFNIHPSLLPKFGGQGMYGMYVHEAVLAAGEQETGITIHLVDKEYDRGPAVAQLPVAVMPGDTPESLARRVQTFEHAFLIETLRQLLDGSLQLPGEADGS